MAGAAAHLAMEIGQSIRGDEGVDVIWAHLCVCDVCGKKLIWSQGEVMLWVGRTAGARKL